MKQQTINVIFLILLAVASIVVSCIFPKFETIVPCVAVLLLSIWLIYKELK